ncbi:hypothetical protein D6C77_06567 [Aureobasidium pullulans]|nr:hypothetical protein D6C79_08944 [Aureobasidium pullulans]TIA56929.1 hypothetical protein D6C77_06567 [Aureobasidium pullulans]
MVGGSLACLTGIHRTALWMPCRLYRIHTLQTGLLTSTSFHYPEPPTNHFTDLDSARVKGEKALRVYSGWQ